MVVTLRKITDKDGYSYVIFENDRDIEFYYVDLPLIKNRGDVNRWIEHLSAKRWFTIDLRNKFADICEKHLSIT